MTWFRVDDGFPEHPKVESLEGDPRRYMAAITVWTVMGADCARRLTDGFVSSARLSKVLHHIGKSALDGASALVSSGIWVVVDGGWQFHDWAEYQPTKACVDASRRSKTDRQRRWRGSRVDASTSPSTDTSVDASEVTAHARGSRPVPSRPVPSQERETRAQAAEPPRHIARMEQSYSTELAEHREIARWFSEHRAEGGAGRWTWDGKAWGSGYEHLDRIRIALADEPDREGTFAAAMRGFLGDERARQHGYPIAWLATDLGGYAARGADDSAERRNIALEAAETEAREAREAYQLRFGKDGPEEDSKRLKRLQAAREGLRKARKAS